MKKLFISALLILGFVSYAMYTRSTSASGPTTVAAANAPTTGSQSGITIEPTTSSSAAGSAPPATASGSSNSSSNTSSQQSASSGSGSASSGSASSGSASSGSSSSSSGGQYRNGTYTGAVADAYYGNIQVQAVISGGKLTNVVFLQYPNDRSTSRFINQQAMPTLKAEAIQAQSANVDGVSGASDSSAAFVQSLGSALAKAQA